MEFIKKTLKRVNFKYLFLMAFLLIFGGLTYRLLFLEQITGTEFVALIIAILFSCLIINFLNEIQELSIGGNLLRLREVKSEVNEAIEQLKLFRVEAFRIFLKNSLKHTGTFGTLGFSDERAKSFIAIVELIKDSGIYDNLKNDINITSNLIIENHLSKLLSLSFYGELKAKFSDYMNNPPSERMILLAVEEKFIEDSSKNLKWEKEKVLKEFNEAIELYTDLLKIKNDSE